MDSPAFRSTLQSGAMVYGIPLDDEALGRFARYARLLADWNTRMNLVSAGDMSRLVEYHFLDSLKLASVLDFSTVRYVLDFGSGAGFPGIPLAIAFPHLAVTLLDSREKRCRFLSGAVTDIPLPSAVVVRSRIEELPREYQGKFDLVVTRATVSLPEFFRLCGGLLAPEGTIAVIKGENIETEFRDLATMVNPSLFNIRVTTPVPVPGVRSGQIVTVSRTAVINTRGPGGNIA